MMCDALAQNLQPPEWTMQVAGSSEQSLILGFVTSGTAEQLARVATTIQKVSMHCELQEAPDKALRLMVLFDSTTTREVAFSLYNRVAKGEFGTTDTALMIVPASEAKK